MKENRNHLKCEYVEDIFSTEDLFKQVTLAAQAAIASGDPGDSAGVRAKKRHEAIKVMTAQKAAQERLAKAEYELQNSKKKHEGAGKIDGNTDDAISGVFFLPFY